MDLSEFLNRGADDRIKIIAGDLPQDNWELLGTCLSRPAATSSSGESSIELEGNLSEANLKNQVARDSIEPLVGAGIGALLGLQVGRVIGVAGLLGAAGGAMAGHLLTRTEPQVSVNIVLKDGRKFLAVMKEETLEKLKAMMD